MSESAIDRGAAWLDSLSDAKESASLEEQANEHMNRAQEVAGAMGLKSITLEDFLDKDIPPRQMLLAPWLPESGLAMVYAPRGIGKTWFALYAGLAVASGGEFLGWEAPEARRVLIIDGEMPAITMQERLATIVASSEYAPAPGNVEILTPDLQELGMPDLASMEGQLALEAFADKADLIIVDNIATLCRSGKENEGESWLSVQGWALRMRAKGKSVLFVHHAGKGGQQRGTSRREDVLDTVIALRHPKGDSDDSQGARFELHFEKNRGFYGEEAAGREISLGTDPKGNTAWHWSTLSESTFERVVGLLNEGLSQVDIAKELEINKSNVSRHAKRAEREGLVTKSQGGKP